MMSIHPLLYSYCRYSYKLSMNKPHHFVETSSWNSWMSTYHNFFGTLCHYYLSSGHHRFCHFHPLPDLVWRLDHRLIQDILLFHFHAFILDLSLLSLIQYDCY